MFQIAMIEDEEHTRQEVERLISREFEKLKVQDITTEIYKTAEEFLEVKKHYDVVISDIDLPGKSGIDLGRILKAEQKDICLVFLTSYAEFAVDSYVLEAYQYILKRDMKERLPAVLQKIYQEKQKESQNFFWIGGVTDQRKLYHKDIICIRKVKGQKYVEFVMVNGAYKERLALHQIFEDLKSPAFIFIITRARASVIMPGCPIPSATRRIIRCPRAVRGRRSCRTIFPEAISVRPAEA